MKTKFFENPSIKLPIVLELETYESGAPYDASIRITNNIPIEPIIIRLVYDPTSSTMYAIVKLYKSNIHYDPIYTICQILSRSYERNENFIKISSHLTPICSMMNIKLQEDPSPAIAINRFYYPISQLEYVSSIDENKYLKISNFVNKDLISVTGHNPYSSSNVFLGYMPIPQGISPISNASNIITNRSDPALSADIYFSEMLRENWKEIPN